MEQTNGFDRDDQHTREEATTKTTSLAHEIETASIAATTSSIADEGQLDPEWQKSKKEETSTKTVPFYKLFSFADSVDVALMIVGTIGALGNGLCKPFMTVLLGEWIDSFGQNQNTTDVIQVFSKVALKFVYLALIAGVVAFLQVSCWMVTGERQATRMRTLYLKSMIRQDISFFDKEINTGEVVNWISGDTLLIQDATGEKVGKFIQLVSTFCGAFVVAFIKGWLLTLVLLACIPLFVIIGGTTSITISKVSSTAQNAYAKAAIVVEQTIGSIRTVASFSREEHAITIYEKSLLDAYKSGVQEGLTAGLGVGVVQCVVYCTYSLALWFGARMIINKSYTGGDVINVIVAVVIGSVTLGQASPCMTAFSAGQVAAFKMFDIINKKPKIDIYDNEGQKLDDIRGDIELRDVYFSYPTRPDEQIFNGFSLFIPSGMIAAMVGQSGSGKSTVISLIQRFYDPQSGQVLIDGINLKDFQLKWIRKKIGLVSQEPVLFSCSIKDNIAYAKDGATLEEIKAAVEVANATKFIAILPQELDTMVGEHGIQLSGGQKQRIAIARAILKDPRILLLDEATSALDVESESIVQEALDKIMVNRTTVIVAHRLSTIRNANTIAVIHQGKIVEKGSHSKLLENPEGAYSQLIRFQVANKDPEQVAIDLEKSDSIIEFGRQPSQQISSLRSTSQSRVSFEPEKSNHHLGLGVSLDLPIELDVSDTALPKEEASYNQGIPQKFSMLRLARLNKPEVPVLIAGAIAAIINGAIFPTFGLLLAEAVNTFFKPPHQLKEDTKFWALMFAILGVASLFASPVQTYLFSVAGCKLIKRVRSRCFEKVVHMEVSWFDEPENSSGATSARLSTDAATIRALVGDALGLHVQILASAIAGVLIAFTACWQLAFIVLALLPLIGLNGYVQLKYMQGFSKNAKLMYEEASQVANDAINGIRTIASFCAEEKVLELYRNKCEGPKRTGIRQGVISGMGFGASFAMLYLFYGFCVYMGGKLIEEEKTNFAGVFRVFFALITAAFAISKSSGFASDTTKAKSAAASIFAILDRKSKIDPSDESGMTLESVKGEILFHHISFKYPTRPDFYIFQDFNLNIQCGKTVALVGESGSGKSTVIALLQRFYDPEFGNITLDGIEIQRLQLKWLRQQMGLVNQEPFLFNETIRANIAYGKGGNAIEAEILAASELANAHNFVSGLQHGYDTRVGERGVQLSGGQKQRVAIARAIIRNPKILLLDEATSALDVESERVVQDALDKVMLNQTTVVVAHRLSTIKNADVIVVIKNGVVVEEGRHDNLITITDGFYASLVALDGSTPSS